MSFPLDFNNISTWENIDRETACMRLGSSEDNENDLNTGALLIVAELFNRIKDKNERAQFFLNCEKLGLRNWKLFFAYADPCHKDYDTFVQCVLKADESMMKALREEERQMQ